MEINEAFGQGVIQATAVDVDEEQEAALAELFQQIWEDGNIDPSTISLATLAFVAGRAYQTQFSSDGMVTVRMSGPTISAFMEFLTGGGFDA